MKPPRIFLFTLLTLFALVFTAQRFAKANIVALTPDTTPPVITAPANQSFATTTLPAFAILVPATATDDTDPSPVIAYSPLSFPLGTTAVIWTATDASGNFATTTSSVTITNPTPPPAPETATFTLFLNNVKATTTTVILPDSGSPDIALAAEDGPHPAKARSAVAVLALADTAASEFDVTDLKYSSSLGFFVQCLSVPSGGSATCGNSSAYWHFDVNGHESTVGMSSYIVKKDDSIILYYYNSTARQVVLNHSTVAAGSPFTATEQEYNPATGAYATTTGFTIGVISIPDPSAPWIYTEVATSTADSLGQATFTITATGTLAVGLQEDYYYPTAPITITDPAPIIPPSPGGSSGGGSSVSHSNFNIPSGLAFIVSKQNSDGSFASPLSTDWTALAFSSANPGAAKTKLANYLINFKPAFSGVTDYERHAMALEALGINPYSGSPTDCITPIVNAFDGTQIGDPNLDNDDIFSIFPLTRAGYSFKDSIIQKEIAYIIAAQLPDGSWAESPDLTAAAVQAIGPFYMASGYVKATGLAAGFLAKTQKADGGWGNIDSTSWVQTMQNAVKEGDPAHYVPLVSSAGFLPTDYISLAQQKDGGVLSGDRVWSTSYAVVAASGTDWLDLLSAFPKPNASGGASVNSGGISGGAVSTSTPPVLPAPHSTSTPETATSTVAAISPALITASTTPAVDLTKPLPQANKFRAKIKNTRPIQMVLGESTAKPAGQAVANPTPPVNPAANNQPGFFGKIWQAIANFFFD